VQAACSAAGGYSSGRTISAVNPFRIAAIWIALTPLLSAAEPSAPVPSSALGRELFQQRGSNSCAFCHGPEAATATSKMPPASINPPLGNLTAPPAATRRA